MPMPPILPTVDWRAIHASGQSYSEWIQGAEHPENREKMEQALREQALDPQAAGYLEALPRTVHVVAIAEDWCGDVVRHVPVLERLAQAAPRVRVAYITREQHKDVFARFLTNGGEAIPKFVFLSEDFVECGNWGPMPAACRRLIARGKACGDVKRAREKVSGIYQADNDCRMVLDELLELVETAAAVSP